MESVLGFYFADSKMMQDIESRRGGLNITMAPYMQRVTAAEQG